MEFRRSQGRILWCKEAVSVRQMAFHIPWGTVSKQPTQMYNLGTNMNHQPDTSPSHSKISGQTSQCVPQIQGGRRGVGKGEIEDRLPQNEYGTQTEVQLGIKRNLTYQKCGPYLFRVTFASALIRTHISSLGFFILKKTIIKVT